MPQRNQKWSLKILDTIDEVADAGGRVAVEAIRDQEVPTPASVFIPAAGLPFPDVPEFLKDLALVGKLFAAAGEAVVTLGQSQTNARAIGRRISRRPFGQRRARIVTNDARIAQVKQEKQVAKRQLAILDRALEFQYVPESLSLTYGANWEVETGTDGATVPSVQYKKGSPFQINFKAIFFDIGDPYGPTILAINSYDRLLRLMDVLPGKGRPPRLLLAGPVIPLPPGARPTSRSSPTLTPVILLKATATLKNFDILDAAVSRHIEVDLEMLAAQEEFAELADQNDPTATASGGSGVAPVLPK